MMHNDVFEELDGRQDIIDNINTTAEAALPWLSVIPLVGPPAEATANTSKALAIAALNAMINSGKSSNYEHSILNLINIDENLPERTPEGDDENQVLEINPGTLLSK